MEQTDLRNDEPMIKGDSPLPEVKRVFPHEVSSFESWIAPILSQAWEMPIATAIRFMNVWASDGQFNFVHTDHAIGAAQLIDDPMAKAPRIEEIFVVCRPGHESDGLAIYQQWANWGRM